MTSEQLNATIRQRPFAIRMVDGRSFTVSQSDWVTVSPTGRTAILFEKDDSYSVVDLMLMSELGSRRTEIVPSLIEKDGGDPD